MLSFLLPLRSFFYRYGSFQTLERLSTGLDAEIDRKSGAGSAAAVANLSDAAICRLLGETSWVGVGFSRQRVQQIVVRAMACWRSMRPDFRAKGTTTWVWRRSSAASWASGQMAKLR